MCVCHLILCCVICRWVEPSVAGFVPTARTNHAMATVVNSVNGVRVCLFGGSTGVEPLSDLNYLITMTWRVMEARGDMPYTRIGHTATVVR